MFGQVWIKAQSVSIFREAHAMVSFSFLAATRIGSDFHTI